MRLSSVHDSLQRAALRTQSDNNDGMITVRIDEELKVQVTLLCDQTGTSVSEFLRQCCRDLIGDYVS